MMSTNHRFFLRFALSFLFFFAWTTPPLHHHHHHRTATTAAAAAAAAAETLPPPQSAPNTSASAAQQQQKQQATHSAAAIVGRNFLSLSHYSGSRPFDYDWYTSPIDPGTSSLIAKSSATHALTSYASLWQEVPAQPFWGQRVKLRAYFTIAGVGNKDFAALFLRVLDAGGRTLAFDNMSGRRLTAWQVAKGWHEVVVDVPGPRPVHDDGLCLPSPEDEQRQQQQPGDEALPHVIAAGFMLGGGRGSVYVQMMSLDRVDLDVAVTGGPPPWEPPYGF